MSLSGILGSKSIWGALLAAFGYLSDPTVLNILPPTVGKVITAVGVILGVFGLRTAIASNGAAATPAEAAKANGQV